MKKKVNRPIKGKKFVPGEHRLPGTTLEKTNPNFRLIATMTEMSRSKKTWDGETGRINQEMLSRYLNDLRWPIYYVTGPPSMVGGVKAMLVAAGVDEDDIRTDEFAGY